MHHDKIIADGITFDDVLLIPRYSEVLPRQVSLRTRLARS
ncbi:MAG: IMP dehydrogenase, partial [Candidatus Kapabacteria bacterium]|nr:IMP dehydrogenase [Candidatus Kapabacteria bacterium]